MNIQWTEHIKLCGDRVINLKLATDEIYTPLHMRLSPEMFPESPRKLHVIFCNKEQNFANKEKIMWRAQNVLFKHYYVENLGRSDPILLKFSLDLNMAQNLDMGPPNKKIILWKIKKTNYKEILVNLCQKGKRFLRLVIRY